MRLLIAFLILTAFVFADETEKKVKTVYDNNGRAVNQGQDAKGFHRVAGSAVLTSGQATITLNTSTADGRQDVSFISQYTYSGVVWTDDTTNTNTYRLYPLSGTQFTIISSNGADVSTVYYRVEGE